MKEGKEFVIITLLVWVIVTQLATAFQIGQIATALMKVGVVP